MNRKSISVLYEDKDVLVIDKPAGLVVHSATTPKSGVRPAHANAHRDGRTEEPTVVDWVLKNYPEIKGVGDVPLVKDEGLRIKDSERSLNRSGIVHRLDRETSGALLIAKNQKAFWHFKKQFEKQLVKKEYRAFVYGRVKHDEGVIDRPIGRSARAGALWSATRGRKSKEREAVTDYRVLIRMPKHTFLVLFPQTGRTHQIRVHLKAINYPIVCDKLYAPKRPCELGFRRLALHAYSLQCTSPSGKKISVIAPYPKDFEEALKIFEGHNKPS